MEPDIDELLPTIEANIRAGNHVMLDLISGRQIGPVHAFRMCLKPDMCAAEWRENNLDTISFIPIDSIKRVRVLPGSQPSLFSFLESGEYARLPEP